MAAIREHSGVLVLLDVSVNLRCGDMLLKWCSGENRCCCRVKVPCCYVSSFHSLHTRMNAHTGSPDKGRNTQKNSHLCTEFIIFCIESRQGESSSYRQGSRVPGGGKCLLFSWQNLKQTRTHTAAEHTSTCTNNLTYTLCLTLNLCFVP